MDVTLTTRRLVLRAPLPVDVDNIVAGLNDWEVTRFLTQVPFPYAAEDARYWLGILKPPAPGAIHLAIDLPGDGLIGMVSLETALGYWLDRRFHGRGYMTEASTALLKWHFANLPQDVVRCSAHIDNSASRNVQKKLGFAETGTSQMRFVRSQQRDVEHVETTLNRAAFETAQISLEQLKWM